MKRKSLRREIVWGTWHPVTGLFSVHLTRSDAKHSFSAPYDDWKMARHDGWKIIKCRLLPLPGQI